MKKILLSLGLMFAIGATNNVEAAIPVKKNLVEVSQQKTSTSSFEAIGINQEAIQVNNEANAEAAALPASNSGKSQIVAAIICWLVGIIGIHRFYLGYTWQGIVQILTFGGFGIWTLIDFIRILTGSLGPKNGRYSKTF